MQAFVRFLKRQSPPPQLPSFGHGWIALPDGEKWHPFIKIAPRQQATRGKSRGAS
ncbi:phage filamentation protein Fil family protein [Dryocola sp. LX212]